MLSPCIFVLFILPSDFALGGDFTRLGLVQAAERKARVRELLLREPGKHVALILRGVHGLSERLRFPESLVLVPVAPYILLP